ncbi:hypothetical protein SLS60_009644 [Paraconiothyrium brasiliense]|uniref:RING-type domain-containing protein n=1 Tax=Paraconiothyrium brasiliense TaxID=300254 RepID=A0ABR3QUX0_9PLEO
MDNSKAADGWASSITASLLASTIDEAQDANSNRFVALATKSETEGDTNEGHDKEDSPQFGSGNKMSRAEDSKQTEAEAKAEEAATRKAENMGEAEESAEAGAHRNADLECSTCGEHFPVDDYPITQGCEHKFETCRQCLEAWIDSQLDNTIVDRGIRCPSTCDRELSYAELKGQISSDLYSK